MEYFVSRRPIFKVDQNLLGYPLNFIEEIENIMMEMAYRHEYLDINEEKFNFSEITGKCTAFISFNEENLIELLPRKLSVDSTVIDVDATKPPSEELVQALVTLHELGYKICLSDLNNVLEWAPVYPSIAYLKFDFNSITSDDLLRIVDCVGCYPNIYLIAGGVEQREVYEAAMEMGFRYFEGFYFSKPEIKMSRAISPAETSFAALLYQTSTTNVDLTTIIEIIKRDVYLTYKLLNYANTVFFKRREEVSTIKQAVVTLGLCELKRFISIVFTTTLCKGRSNELIRLSLYRGKFCEMIANMISSPRSIQQDSAEAFLIGLLSLIDAIFNEPADLALKKLALSDRIKSAILNQDSEMSSYLACAKYCEQGRWENALACAEKDGLNTSDIKRINGEALIWADNQMDIMHLD